MRKPMNRNNQTLEEPLLLLLLDDAVVAVSPVPESSVKDVLAPQSSLYLLQTHNH